MCVVSVTAGMSPYGKSTLTLHRREYPLPVGVLHVLDARPRGPNLGDGVYLCVDDAKPHRDFWLLLDTKPAEHIRKHPFAFPCVSLCQRPLRRPHLLCLHCRLRHVWQNKLPNLLRMRIAMVEHPRQMSKLQAWLFKRLWELAELLSD